MSATPYFTMSQTIARTVQEVFATTVRLDEFPRWSPRNPWAKKLTPGEIGEGTRFQMGIKGFGKITSELREFEANRRVLVAAQQDARRRTLLDLHGSRVVRCHESCSCMAASR